MNGMSSADLDRALTGAGVQMEIGPFFVRVRSELPGVRAHIERMYEGFPIRAADGGQFDLAVVSGAGLRRWVRRQAALVVDGARPFLPLPADLAGPLIEWGMNWCIGTKAHQWTTVHAAVVERGGRALIMPASSGSGKSTLCAALAFSGWRLFSDEFALIDARTLQVYPAPRPLSLKEASIEIVKARHPDVVYGPEAHDVEGARFVHARPPSDAVLRAQETARPGWIVLPKYAAGRPTTIERLPRARALMAVADQSFNYNCLGPSGYECLASLVRESECYTLEYSELDDLLPRLAELTAG
jgi:HprK-related kinase A